MQNVNLKVAILDNSINPEAYTPVAHWSAFLSVPWQAYKCTRGEFPLRGDGITHVIVSGSEASIIEREPWVEEEVAFVQEAATSGIPLLGSCYGHQILALALLGPAHVQRCKEPEMGWLTIDIIHPTAWCGGEKDFTAFTLHFDEVTEVADAFKVMGATQQCPIHVMQHHTLPIWGIQAHPEIDIPAAKTLLQNFMSSDPRHKELYQEALFMDPQDSKSIEPILREFLHTKKRDEN
jgi:GMP synthase-like glutamine amidotransferase